MSAWYSASGSANAGAGGAGSAGGAGIESGRDAEMFAWLSQHSLFVRERLEEPDFPHTLGPLLEIMYPGQRYPNDDMLRDLRAAFEHPPRIPLADLWITAKDNPRRLQPPSAVFALMDEADRWGLPTSIVDDLAIDALQCFLAGMVPSGSVIVQDIGWIGPADHRAPAVAAWMRARALAPQERQREHGMGHIERVWRLWRDAFSEWYMKLVREAGYFPILFHVDVLTREPVRNWREPLPRAMHFVLGSSGADAGTLNEWCIVGACGRDMSGVFGPGAEWAHHADTIGNALGLGGNTAVIAKTLAAAVAKHGRRSWLLDDLRQGCFLGAIARGNLRVVQEMFSADYLPSHATEIAARFGHLDVLQWLHARGFTTVLVCNTAAKWNQLDVLKWARAQVPPCPWSTETCKNAASGGYLPVLKWLRAQDPPCPWNFQTCDEAVLNNDMEVLQWARAQVPPCPWDIYACAIAAGRGDLDMLKWLRAQDPPCPWDTRTCDDAAKRNFLEILQWARAQVPPCPWSEMTCREAASEGHLALLQWLRAQVPPCPWDERTCEYAAGSGHLEVLKWLRAQVPPCPWNRETCAAARWGGRHMDVVAWALANGCPPDIYS